MMSFNDAFKLFSAPAWASHSQRFLDATCSFTPAFLVVVRWSEPGGGAAVFPAFGQSSFCGTNPMEFDEYSKAFYPLSLFPGTPLLAPPAFGVRQSCKPGRKMLCPA
ncbi:hypothetical protein F2Q68_00010573 [Brassica cretica]|uniref:Uncharacterized protein n=1 Tax=Brassica cretica TaxID=69181 RepID=A0A8S9L1L3_BRACR|nr:hypothetical protein F2Q68_00010573 [Brassica cretica]